MQQSGWNPSVEHLFAVYGIESPAYPDRFIGGVQMWHPWKTPATFPGTALLIGGGRLESGQRIRDDWRILLTGITWWEWETLRALCERVVAELASPFEKILLLLEDGQPEPTLSECVQAGFEVLETSDGIVCIGSGEMLRSVHWMRGAHDFSQTAVFSFEIGSHPLETYIIDAAKAKQPVLAMVDATEAEAYRRQDAKIVSYVYSGCQLRASFGGSDGHDLLVHMAQADVQQIRQVILQAATGTDLLVFDAGTLTELEQSGYFTGGEDWRPVPPAWAIVRDAEGIRFNGNG
jgi:hypothetical protein